MLDHVHYPHALQLPSPEITHFTDVNPDRGYQIVTQTVAGKATPCFVGVSSANPVIPFTTQQLKSVLDALTTDSLAVDLSASTVYLYYRAGKPMANREDLATAVHNKAQLANSAMLYLQSLSVNQGSVAELSCQIVTAKRGASDPMVWVGSQSLTAAAGCQRLYGMGPCYLNSTLLEGVTGWNMSFNVGLESVPSDGEKVNSYIGIRTFHPQIRLSSMNMDEIINSSFGGDSFNTLELYLQRMVSTDIYDDAANATHIKVTAYGGLRTVPGVSGSPATLEPMFYTINDGSNPTHAFNTATTIT